MTILVVVFYARCTK